MRRGGDLEMAGIGRREILTGGELREEDGPGIIPVDLEGRSRAVSTFNLRTEPPSVRT